jgi:hypothetical protein
MKGLAVVRLVAVLVLLVFIVGCGGGGGGSKSVEGIANINEAAENPKVAIIYDAGGNNWQTLSCSGMDRSSSGWRDVDFKTGLPHDTGVVCALLIFNDYDDDNKYDYWDWEELGVYDGYLLYNDSTDKWEVYSLSNIRRFSDASKCRDYDMYIDCPYARSATRSGGVDKSSGSAFGRDKLTAIAGLNK